MPTLRVTIEEGFNEDSVRLKIGDREIYSKDQVTTRNQIGLADKVEIETPEGDCLLNVHVPSRSVLASIPLQIKKDTYLGISITPEGEIQPRHYDRPRGFV